MAGENGHGGDIHVESEREKELRECKERANKVITRTFDVLKERFEEPSDGTVEAALADMLMRDGADVPGYLDADRGRNATDIPKEEFEKTRELLKMPFHRVAHTREVVERTEEILEAMVNGGVALSEMDFQLGRMIAAGHDLVQKWTTVERPNGKIERVRFKVRNERESADQLLGIMAEYGCPSVDEQVVRAAFDATIPDGWDGSTVVQKHLTSESHPLVRAVALADLGAAGMDPDSYVRGGDELFVEENLDMLVLDIDTLDETKKEAYRERMLAWSQVQISFAEGRKARFEEELGNLPEEAKEQLRQVFQHFDASIQKAQEHFARREAMSFEDVYEVMGFKSAK